MGESDGILSGVSDLLWAGQAVRDGLPAIVLLSSSAVPDRLGDCRDTLLQLYSWNQFVAVYVVRRVRNESVNTVLAAIQVDDGHFGYLGRQDLDCLRT